MSRKSLLRLAAALYLPLSLLLPAPARADGGAAIDMVKGVTEEVLTIIRNDKEIQAGDRDRAIVVIEAKVAPHFDFTRMTRLAVGTAWQQADPQQREALVREFRTLLVRTYANTMTSYRDQRVAFKPTPAPDASDEITVRSHILRPGGQPVPVDYSLNQSAGTWKVFDVAVANISLVNNFRGSFASEVERGGIDGLIQTLREKNRRFDGRPTVATAS